MPVVVIGCKIPNGIIMELRKPDGSSVRAVARGSHTAREPGGIGITKDIDAQFAEEWFKRNKGLKMVTRGFIFAAATIEEAEAMGKLDTAKTGFEPLKRLQKASDNDAPGKLAEVDPKAG